MDQRFFDKAFQIYRDKFNNNRRQVMFLAVSDDNQWIKVIPNFTFKALKDFVKDHLSQHEDVRFGVDYSSVHVDERDRVGFDLCVLASSHHNIFTFGTFGLWGSLLAGGEVIAAKGTHEKLLTEEDEIYLMSAMPGWMYIDTRFNATSVLNIDDEIEEFVPIQ